MGLTRSSSGLLVYDAYGSDTSADYDTASGVAASVSDGALHIGALDAWAVHAGALGAKCVTIRSLVASSEYGMSAILSNNGSLASSDDYDGYQGYVESGWLYLGKLTDGGNSWIGYTEAGSLHTDCLIRIYRTATAVIVRAGGTSSFAYSVSVNDTTYATTLYGGVKTGTQSSPGADWFEARTAHTITCSGMTTGHYLRVSDGTTAAEAQESSGTATVDAGAVLFPLTSVQIRTAHGGGGTLIDEITSATLADMGGGDAFAYSAAAGGLSIPLLNHLLLGD